MAKQHSDLLADESSTECIGFAADDPRHVSFTADGAEYYIIYAYGSG
jgi:hypothetical protein